MELYTTQQICKKITWLTGRIIIGIVSKGLVAPFKGSEGTGDHRLYSKDDIFELIVAGSVRGMFDQSTMIGLMHTVRKYRNEADFINLTPSDRTSNRAVADVKIHRGPGDFDSIIPSEMTGRDGEIIKGDGFATVVINLKAIEKFVKTNF